LNGFLSRLISREAGEVTPLSPVPGKRFETPRDLDAPAFAPWTDPESGDDFPAGATAVEPPRVRGEQRATPVAGHTERRNGLGRTAEDTPKPLPAPAVPAARSQPVELHREPDPGRDDRSPLPPQPELSERRAENQQHLGALAKTTLSKSHPNGHRDAFDEARPGRQPSRPPPLASDRPEPQLETDTDDPHTTPPDDPRQHRKALSAEQPPSPPKREEPSSAAPTSHGEPPATSSKARNWSREAAGSPNPTAPAARGRPDAFRGPTDQSDDSVPDAEPAAPNFEAAHLKTDALRDGAPMARRSAADPGRDTAAAIDRPGNDRQHSGTSHRIHPATATGSANEPGATVGGGAGPGEAEEIITRHAPAGESPGDGPPHVDKSPPQRPDAPPPGVPPLQATVPGEAEAAPPGAGLGADRPSAPRSLSEGPQDAGVPVEARAYRRPRPGGSGVRTPPLPADRPGAPRVTPPASRGDNEANGAQVDESPRQPRGAPSSGMEPPQSSVPNGAQPAPRAPGSERKRPTFPPSSSKGRRGVASQVDAETPWRATVGASPPVGSSRPAEPKAAGTEMPVQVRIGRIDARPRRATPAERAAPAEPRGPNMTLQQYLERRRRPPIR
jgi:hypothetical protein